MADELCVGVYIVKTLTVCKQVMFHMK